MKPRWDVAVSYASEDKEAAEAVARRLHEDGFSVFYAAYERHHFFGQELGVSLAQVYGELALMVVAVVSSRFFEKPYPLLEFRTALKRQTEASITRLVIVRLDDAALPPDADSARVITASRREPGQAARTIAAILYPLVRAVPFSERRLAAVGLDVTIPTVEALDHPQPGYSMEDVTFESSELHWRIDPFAPLPDLPASRFVTGPVHQELGPEDLDVAASARPEDVRGAQDDVRVMLKRRQASEWPVFNGAKLGVALLQRRRRAHDEANQLHIRVYDTDYHTHLFARMLYRRLLSRGGFRQRAPGHLAGLSGLLTSFGFNLFVICSFQQSAHLYLIRRSRNVANPGSATGKMHVSMNEGLSETDRSERIFDASGPIFRGLREELHLEPADVGEIHLLEPFLWTENLELGILGYTTAKLDFDAMRREHQSAKDGKLETAHAIPIAATIGNCSAFLQNFGDDTTDILKFGLARLAARQILRP